MVTYLVRVATPALLAALALGAVGCSNTLPAKPVRRDVPTAQGFTALEIDDLDVVVRLGHAHQVSLRCDPELAPYARLRVVGDVLRAELDDEPVRLFDIRERPCVADVYMPSLRSIRVEGSGDVRVIGTAEGLQSIALGGSGDADVDAAAGEAPRFELTGSGDLRVRRLEARRADFSLTGSGDVRINEGAVADARMSSSGSGDVNAGGLVAETAEVRTTGSGDIRLIARQRADLRASGSGDIVVTGAPLACHAQTSGSGSAVCR